MSLKEKFIGKNGFNPNGLHKMKLPLPPPPPPKEVYTFQSEDLEENILYGNNNVVRAGTLEKLVERLTSEKVSGWLNVINSKENEKTENKNRPSIWTSISSHLSNIYNSKSFIKYIKSKILYGITFRVRNFRMGNKTKSY